MFRALRAIITILDGYDSKTIVDQVERCPSGALSIELAIPETEG